MEQNFNYHKGKIPGLKGGGVFAAYLNGQSMPGTERQTLHTLTRVWNLNKQKHNGDFQSLQWDDGKILVRQEE